jgi:hypothetical protein
MASRIVLSSIQLVQFTNILPPLRSSSKNSWLQIQRSWFDSRSYLIFWGVVGLERRPLGLVSTELFFSDSAQSNIGLMAAPLLFVVLKAQNPYKLMLMFIGSFRPYRGFVLFAFRNINSVAHVVLMLTCFSIQLCLTETGNLVIVWDFEFGLLEYLIACLDRHQHKQITSLSFSLWSSVQREERGKEWRKSGRRSFIMLYHDYRRSLDW